MKQITSIDRDQIQFTSLDMMVTEDSMVRLIDVFLDFACGYDLGFQSNKQVTGRPSFPSRTLLGIYIYGYLNRTRSSRSLAKSCVTNIELMWLIKGHKPCYKTIANFRKDNRQAFGKLFKLYRSFCINLDLYGKEVIAIDGSKFRAQNSMKNNFNQKKIDRHLEYIDKKEQEYLDSLDEQDKATTIVTHERLAQLSKRKIKYESLKDKLEQSEETQISTVDPDARALPLHMRIVEVSYNLQSSVDDKHNLIVDYEITNKNDSRALAPMAIKSKGALGLRDDEKLIVLADKGYHSGVQMEACHDHNIETVVAIPRKPTQTDRSKPEYLHKDKFDYDPDSDTYTCPTGQVLNKQGRYARKNNVKFDRYTIKNSKCKLCKHYELCISPGNRRSSQGRYIDRYLTDKAVLRNRLNVANNKALYKRRQAIVEHPFGTIKRAWGFTYTLMKTQPKVETEFTLIMLCYNLRRTMSILGIEELKKAFKRAFYSIFTVRSYIQAQRIKFLVACHLRSLSLS